jgi:hypothetical protein
MLEKLPLGTLSGAAQDSAELAIARGILGMENESPRKFRRPIGVSQDMTCSESCR